MRQARLLAALLLLLLPLAALRAAAGFPVQVYAMEDVYPSDNGKHVSLSVSGGGGGELEGGYGAVIKAVVAPLVGAPYWSASGSVTVYAEDVSYTVTVRVFFINPSTGLSEWRYLASATGTTYTQTPWVFEVDSDIRPVEYWKEHKWTLPSSGDYPARVRVDFSMSAKGWALPNLKNGDAMVVGGGYGTARKEGGAGTVLPLAQLSVSSTPIPVTVSYSGAVSGSASTPFTLYGVGRDLTVTLTAPSSVTAGGKTYAFVKWRTSDGETTSTSVTITVTQGSSKWATAAPRACY